MYLATDHAGFELKEKVKEFLKKDGYLVEDCGAYEFDKDDDYPDFISKAAKEVSKDPENSKAIIFGGSGQGEAIVANKYPNIRAVVYYGNGSTQQPLEMIPLTREHNNANVLSLGARFISEEVALKVIKLWLDTPFSGDERHIRRIEKIKKIEQSI
ncbi:RpiB/LacA/LacB family sugar-phosphate isomerase [Candidatus Daviesbacteria bacterium]|nr:RpiB/LacA/LacB family sugar-phosphate isomerase [Candidatus Daviesbacteria bacterium]